MHNHSTGQRLIQCRSVTSIVQKTYFIRAGRLQRGHTFEEQLEFIRNPACCALQQLRVDMAHFGEKFFIARSCFDHFPLRASELDLISISFDGVDIKANVSFGSFASILACPQHVRLRVISEMPVVRFCRLKASVWT